MALTCKNCGGNIVFDKDRLICICDSCGKPQSNIDDAVDILCDGKQTTIDAVKKYKRALQVMNTASSENMFTMAALLFDEARNFSDSAERAQECRLRASEFRRERQYLTALNDMQSSDPKKIANARETLIALGNYKDAAENAEKCPELYKAAVKNQPKVEVSKPKDEKKNKKRRFPLFLITVIIIISAIIGHKHWENTVYSADSISIEFTPQENSFLSEYNNRYVFNFSVLLENNGEKDVEAIDGIVAFINKNGNVIVDTEVSFVGNPIAVRHGKSAKYTWELTVYSEDVARELYYTNFDDFDIEFEIKSMRFSDGKTITFD